MPRTRANRATAEAVPLAERGQAKLEALPKPSDESAALDKVYAAQQTQVNQIKALANAVNAGDATKIQSISATLSALGGPHNSQFGSDRMRLGLLGQLTRRLWSLRALGCCCLSARTFASHEVKDATELTVGVSSAGFEFDRGRRRHLLGVGGV